MLAKKQKITHLSLSWSTRLAACIAGGFARRREVDVEQYGGHTLADRSAERNAALVNRVHH